MKTSVTFKPILWRLMVWKFAPICLAWLVVKSLYEKLTNSSSSLSIFSTVLVLLIGAIIATIIIHKKFEIVVAEDNISGLGPGWFLPRETFPVASVDISYRHKQSFDERVLFYHTMHSVSGQKIMVADFIYGRPVTNELYSLLEKKQLTSNTP